MPLGFVNALAKNEDAMKKFALMEKSEKEVLLQKAHQVSSKEEMTPDELYTISKIAKKICKSGKICSTLANEEFISFKFLPL